MNEALIMDPQTRVFLEESWKAIEDSGNAISQFKGRVSMYAGAGMNTYILRALQQGVLQNYDNFDIMLGSDKDLLATQVAYKLNLTGPSFSAKSQTSLFKNMEQVVDWLKKEASSLGSIATTLQTGRECFAIRKAVVSRDKQELLSKLQTVIAEAKAERSTVKPIYFLVTGEGSQYVNMAKGLYENIGMVKDIIDAATSLLKEKYGVNLLEILYPYEEHNEVSKALIKNTEYAQPLIFIVSYALGRYLMSIGIEPDKIIGHSLGEYVGACLADVMTFEVGLDIIYWRGKYLQNANTGSLLVVKVFYFLG